MDWRWFKSGIGAHRYSQVSIYSYKLLYCFVCVLKSYVRIDAELRVWHWCTEAYVQVSIYSYKGFYLVMNPVPDGTQNLMKQLVAGQPVVLVLRLDTPRHERHFTVFPSNLINPLAFSNYDDLITGVTLYLRFLHFRSCFTHYLFLRLSISMCQMRWVTENLWKILNTSSSGFHKCMQRRFVVCHYLRRVAKRF